MAIVSLRMSEHLAAEVHVAARRRGVSASALIREAIETFLSGDDAAQPRSALDLVADLAGSCEGPEDLSTNKKYMEGLGE
ncbi:MAG: ribbon-helix-helix domain-containing protein [Gemmatimonadetes bacterium]|nr:ribbon-helix-helix domain-containing protein [Candidatus Palauibacter rhopaloidicola]